MSRIRSIHPGWFTDEATMTVRPLARLLALGLWIEADDHGVFEWKPIVLKVRILPADNVDVGALLNELASADVVRQVTHEGKVYGLIRNFCTYQHPKHPSYRFPFPVEWRCYTGCKAGKSVAREEASPSPPPGRGEPSPTERREEEGRGEERREEESGDGGDGALARAPAPDLKNPAGERIAETWQPDDDTREQIGAILPPAMVGHFIDRFVVAYYDSDVRSTDWNAKLLREAQKAAPKPPRKRAPPRVEVTKTDTRPPPGVIGQPARELAARVVARLALEPTDTLAIDLPQACQRWITAGIDAEIIETNIVHYVQTQQKVPQGASFFDKILQRAQSTVLSGSVTADTTKPAGTPNVRPARTRTTEPSFADRQLAALAREEEAAGGRSPETESAGAEEAD